MAGCYQFCWGLPLYVNVELDCVVAGHESSPPHSGLVVMAALFCRSEEHGGPVP